MRDRKKERGEGKRQAETEGGIDREGDNKKALKSGKGENSYA